MALPFLPGNSFDKNLGKTRFHKSHCFDYRNTVPVFEEQKPGIGGIPLPGQPVKKKTSTFPEGVGPRLPTWVAFEKQVLRFYAYFQESVEELREEQYRIRHCVILFYLEDDSIQVNERKMPNSGIPQGTLIRRHRIPLPPPSDDQFYTVEHFNVGALVQFYSKTFKITACDGFTMNFLRKLGVKVPSFEPYPPDPYTQHRQKIQDAMQPLRPYERLDKLQQFLEHDRQVLRFYCYWDDRDSEFGDIHYMELHYFLADDTIELLEKLPPNSGRDAMPVFMHRAKLPKEHPGLPQPGVVTSRTVLNVFGPTGHGGRYIYDSTKTGAIYQEYYHESDLVIGAVVNVWGRRVILCDCDDFTKHFYSTKYGIDKFEPVKLDLPSPPAVKAEIPPYTGFGSDEDSLASHFHIIPRPPRKDFIKFMEKDRQGLDSNVLRFVAQLITTDAIQCRRKFIVSYYLSDDTISVFEPQIRNSGIIGGSFLERQRLAKPTGSPGDPTTYYQPEDMYVGAEVVFNKFHFVLSDADEYAFHYMERQCHRFPHANLSLILSKLRGPATAHVNKIKTAFSEADSRGTGTVAYNTFKMLVRGLTQGLLNEHEIITLAREYGEKSWPPLSSLVRIIHADLKQQNYTAFGKLEDELKKCDAESTGYVSKDQVHHACHMAKVPLSDQLIDGTIMNCHKDDKGRLPIEEFVRLLNYLDNPPPVSEVKEAAGSCGLDNAFGQDREVVSNIEYKKLLAKLTGPDIQKQ